MKPQDSTTKGAADFYRPDGAPASKKDLRMIRDDGVDLDELESPIPIEEPPIAKEPVIELPLICHCRSFDAPHEVSRHTELASEYDWRTEAERGFIATARQLSKGENTTEEGWLNRTQCPGCNGIFGAKYLADHLLACALYARRHGWSRNEELAALEQRLDTIMADVRRAREMKDAIDKQVASIASDIQTIKERAA
jgi:hypothetical protein